MGKFKTHPNSSLPKKSRQRTQETGFRAERRAMHLIEFVPYPMAVLKPDGRVSYINPAFTDLFGWTLDELAGGLIPFVPPNAAEVSGREIKMPDRKRPIRRYETRRSTKGGRELDVAIRSVSLAAGGDDDDAQMLILRDLTREKRAALNNELLLRIGMALPAYPELEKLEGQFDRTDVELLTMIAGTVALFIENARVSEALKEAYREVTSSNRAKEKAINHLSHELKTPVSVLKASLSFLEKKVQSVPQEIWRPGLERARRNLNRIVDIQQQTEDIRQNRPCQHPGLLALLMDDCADELEALVTDETGEASVAVRIRKRIEDIYGGKADVVSEIDLCPGLISRCAYCKGKKDCYQSGGTVFTLFFPLASEPPGIPAGTDT